MGVNLKGYKLLFFGKNYKYEIFLEQLWQNFLYVYSKDLAKKDIIYTVQKILFLSIKPDGYKKPKLAGFRFFLYMVIVYFFTVLIKNACEATLMVPLTNRRVL